MSPALTVHDAAAALAFYREALGATELYRLVDPQSGKIGHAEVLINKSLVMISDEYPTYNQSPMTLGGTALKLSLMVDDVDTWVERAKAAGAEVVMPAADQFYGHRSGSVRDPFGHVWMFQSEIEKVSPEEMQKRWNAMVLPQEKTPGEPQRITLTFRPATPADIPLLQTLAWEIWTHCYTPMLAAGQVDYMLEWMYSAKKIQAEMDAGILWFLASLSGTAAAFFSLECASGDSRIAYLHKLYLLPALHGNGHGQMLLQEAATHARQRGCTTMELRVNKANGKAIRAYERAGFQTVDSIVADIGGGYVMDDFVMRLALADS